MTQVVECLSSKRGALNPNPSTAKRGKGGDVKYTRNLCTYLMTCLLAQLLCLFFYPKFCEQCFS
jgi:hypothetical protein